MADTPVRLAPPNSPADPLTTALELALERIAEPHVVVNDQRVAVYANPAARECAAIELSTRRFKAVDALSNQKLQAAISFAFAAAQTTAPVPFLKPPQPFALTDEAGVSWRAIVTPVAGGAVALVQLRREQETMAGLAAWLAATKGLTASEVGIAMKLAGGMPLKKASEAQGIAYETGRKHLRRLMGRLGVARQADLLLLLSRRG